jgi:chromosome partitioning protein
MKNHKKATRQIRLDIKSNAGGTGKTTLATHLAYALGSKGYTVTLLELDPQGSLKVFSGLDNPLPEQTLAYILSEEFAGNYPLTPIWKDAVKGINVIQGGIALERSIKEVTLHERGYYLLRDRLEDYPLESNVIIFDNPASLEPMGLVALTAATHVIVPIQCEYKAVDGAGGLVEWFYNKIQTLRLRPKPEILGFVPSRVDLASVAAHRNIVKILPQQLEQIGIHCFEPIRNSNEFINASGSGLPLQLYRPGNPACQDFEPIVAKLVELLHEQ